MLDIDVEKFVQVIAIGFFIIFLALAFRFLT